MTCTRPRTYGKRSYLDEVFGPLGQVKGPVEVLTRKIRGEVGRVKLRPVFPDPELEGLRGTSLVGNLGKRTQGVLRPLGT